MNFTPESLLLKRLFKSAFIGVFLFMACLQAEVRANTPFSPPVAVNDTIYLGVNSDKLFEVWNNDLDADGDLDPLTVTNAGLLAPSNGAISISPLTGEIVYSPNPGYTGTDAFEYQICDRAGDCSMARVELIISNTEILPFADSDGDGILDRDDLDDENDGVPDSIEQGIIIDHSQPACGGETNLDFSSPSVLEWGTDLQIGAIYRIADITTGTDALITITEIYNASIATFDNNSSDAHAFRPDTAFNFVNAGDQAMIEYNIRFVESGGTLPVVIDKIFMNFNDIDGTNQYAEQTWALNPTNYVISNPTELTMYTDGSWVVGTAGTNTYGGASNVQPTVNFGASYDFQTEMTIRVGALARVAGANSIQRLHHIEFECITNYINPDVFGMDFDFDGVSNHLDLDSDNDGIYDGEESGHNQTLISGILSGPFGGNGLADAVESGGSGNINYTIRNSDAAEGNDYLDTDADNDGCSDANEAYSDANADGGDNFFYALGSPPAVDEMGRVLSATYPLPADQDGNTIPEYREFNAPIVNQHPADAAACSGADVSFSIDATDADIFQWEIYDGTDWIPLSDDATYSGTTTAMLSLNTVSTGLNGSQYRAVVSSSTYTCSLPSLEAFLTVIEPNVIANASATNIDAGESVTLFGSGADTYTWDQGVTDGVPITPYVTTTFTVTGIDTQGCVNTDSITITVNTDVDLVVTKMADVTEASPGDLVEFTVRVENTGSSPATNIEVSDELPPGYSLEMFIVDTGTFDESTWLWTIPILQANENATLYMLAMITETESYTNIAEITAMDQDDMVPSNNSDQFTIDVLFPDCLVVYNEFSPNKDGANEYLYVECIEQYPDNILQVFDRWGTLVYKKEGYDNSWDGTRQANFGLGSSIELPVGTYYYILQLDTEASLNKTGWIYLSR